MTWADVDAKAATIPLLYTKAAKQRVGSELLAMMLQALGEARNAHRC